MFVALEVARAFLRKNGKSAYEKCARNHKAWPREMSSRKFLETFLVNLGSAMKYMGGALTDLFPDVLTSNSNVEQNWTMVRQKKREICGHFSKHPIFAA